MLQNEQNSCHVEEFASTSAKNDTNNLYNDRAGELLEWNVIELLSFRYRLR